MNCNLKILIEFLCVLMVSGLFFGASVLLSNIKEKAENRNIYIRGIPRPTTAIALSVVGLLVFECFNEHSPLQLVFLFVGLFFALYSVRKKMNHAGIALLISVICLSLCFAQFMVACLSSH